MALTVSLMGPSPWGFRIYGGRDFKKAITVSKVNGGSKAEQAALQPGDIILEINGQNTADMLNVEAQNKIKNSKTQLQLVVERPVPEQTNGGPGSEDLTSPFKTKEAFLYTSAPMVSRGQESSICQTALTGLRLGGLQE
ncbi:unnamed protein product [Arctogadus glacialis]